MELTIRQLSVELGNQPILKSIDLSVKSGTMTTLLGQSGCGKSTLLKSIAGLVPIASGEIYLGDRLLNSVVPEKRKAVIVFQDLRLFPHLNVEKNIRFAMEIDKKPPDYQEQKVKELLNLVRLDGFEKRKISEMSGGQMQRVALARALASEPEILLLDEPFSSLDEGLREDMARLVRKIQQEHKITTILVTHDKSEALKVADQVVLMDKGQILQTDSPFRIFNHPADRKVAAFFGHINWIGEHFVRPSKIRLVDGEQYTISEILFLGELVKIVLQGNDVLYCVMDSEEFYAKNLSVGSLVGIRIG